VFIPGYGHSFILEQFLQGYFCPIRQWIWSKQLKSQTLTINIYIIVLFISISQLHLVLLELC